MEQTKTAYHIVLVHGSCHGAWCWYKLSTLLTSHGHQVTALDLAASGINSTKIQDLKSFDEYSKPLYDTMDSIPEGEKIVLVGHSLGGLSIAKAMQMFPHKIHVAVFVAASLPQLSYSIYHCAQQYDKQEASKSDVMDNQGFFIEDMKLLARQPIFCLVLNFCHQTEDEGVMYDKQEASKSDANSCPRFVKVAGIGFIFEYNTF